MQIEKALYSYLPPPRSRRFPPFSAGFDTDFRFTIGYSYCYKLYPLAVSEVKRNLPPPSLSYLFICFVETSISASSTFIPYLILV